MAISQIVVVQPAALWPQGDIRDPLGVWGFRLGVTGDATGGGIKVIAQTNAEDGAAYLYTCYSLNLAVLTGAVTSGTGVKARLLTGWPNIDPIAGVQAYSSAVIKTILGGAVFTAPTLVVTEPLVSTVDRFLLLFDPRASAGVLSLVEMVLGENIDLATYSFEGYGYFWDRSVLNAPGGPRHPGAN